MRLAIVSKDLNFITTTKQECELEEQIVKAKILIFHAKQKLEIEKTLPQNSETSAITFQHFK